jgi:hypothetical protein
MIKTLPAASSLVANPAADALSRRKRATPSSYPEHRGIAAIKLNISRIAAVSILLSPLPA